MTTQTAVRVAFADPRVQQACHLIHYRMHTEENRESGQFRAMTKRCQNLACVKFRAVAQSDTVCHCRIVEFLVISLPALWCPRNNFFIELIWPTSECILHSLRACRFLVGYAAQATVRLYLGAAVALDNPCTQLSMQTTSLLTTKPFLCQVLRVPQFSSSTVLNVHREKPHATVRPRVTLYPPIVVTHEHISTLRSRRIIAYSPGKHR